MKAGMKGYSLALALILLPVAASAVTIETEGDKISYSVGYQVGKDLQRQKVEFNPEVMIRGVIDGAKGADPAIPSQEMEKTLNLLKQKIMAIQQEERERFGREAAKAGMEYMATNAKAEGVRATKSGLQYKTIREGGGKTPGPTDTVSVHYRGTLVDGTEFDSSYSRGQPVSFPLGRVIKGWTEGLQLMKEGGKYQLVIPPELGYGPRPTGKIPPNSTLVFEIELLSVE